MGIEICIDCTRSLLVYDWVKLSKKTILCYTDPNTNEEVELLVQYIKRWNNGQKKWEEADLDRKYTLKSFGSAPVSPWLKLYFSFADFQNKTCVSLPETLEKISVKEKVPGGFKWIGIHIRPVDFQYDKYKNIGEKTTMDSIIEHSRNIHAGTYESLDDIYSWTCAFIENNQKPCLVLYSHNKERSRFMRVGDVIAELRPTANSNVYIGTLYDIYNQTSENIKVLFERETMTIIREDNPKITFIKMLAPQEKTGNNATELSGTGSGIIISGNILATNYHVIKDATNIKVLLNIDGSFEEFQAKVLSTDKTNDLALITIKDERFSPLPPAPYRISPNSLDVGTSVFTMGYPLSTILGKEVKITDGIISSKTGYEDDAVTYQITAPIQPGNSGGALFDKKGLLVGITNANVPTAENVGYAIKSSYLLNLIDSAPITIDIPKGVDLSQKEFTDIIKLCAPYVALIRIY